MQRTELRADLAQRIRIDNRNLILIQPDRAVASKSGQGLVDAFTCRADAAGEIALRQVHVEAHAAGFDLSVLLREFEQLARQAASLTTAR